MYWGSELTGRSLLFSFSAFFVLYNLLSFFSFLLFTSPSAMGRTMVHRFSLFPLLLSSIYSLPPFSAKLLHLISLFHWLRLFQSSPLSRPLLFLLFLLSLTHSCTKTCILLCFSFALPKINQILKKIIIMSHGTLDFKCSLLRRVWIEWTRNCVG